MTTTAQYLVSDACTACGACLLTCPDHAIRPVDARLQVSYGCRDCGECVEVCPVDAVSRVVA